MASSPYVLVYSAIIYVLILFAAMGTISYGFITGFKTTPLSCAAANKVRVKLYNDYNRYGFPGFSSQNTYLYERALSIMHLSSPLSESNYDECEDLNYIRNQFYDLVESQQDNGAGSDMRSNKELLKFGTFLDWDEIQILITEDIFDQKEIVALWMNIVGMIFFSVPITFLKFYSDCSF